MSPVPSSIPAESHLRSILKGISWRLVATSATILIAGSFLRDWGLAAAIGGTEASAKLLLYYLHERLWQLAPPGSVVAVLKHGAAPDTTSAVRYRESHTRSVLKTVSWRVVATATTTLIAWGATSDATMAAWIGGVEATSKLFLYYFHERLWQVLPRGTVARALLGRRESPAAEPPRT